MRNVIRAIVKKGEWNNVNYRASFDITDIDELSSNIDCYKEVETDCEDRNDNFRFFELYDEEGDLINRIAIERDELNKVEFKNHGSTLEITLLNYSFTESRFIPYYSFDVVKSDYIFCLRGEAIDMVSNKIVEEFGTTNFSSEKIETFFDDLLTEEEAWMDNDGTIHYYLGYLLESYARNNNYNKSSFADYCFDNDRSLSEEDLNEIDYMVNNEGLEETVKKLYEKEY